MSSTLSTLALGVMIGLFLQGSFIIIFTFAVAALVVGFYLSFQPRGTTISSEGKAVLVTGCDSGFGKSLAERLDEYGFTVIACCLFPDEEGANDLRKKCSSRLQVVEMDVTNDEQVKNVVSHVEANVLGSAQLWAIVNNAGLAQCAEVEWTPMTMYEKHLAVNTLGVVRVTKAFLPILRKYKGRVVNVASVAGRLSLAGFTAYCMSKHSCVAFTEGLRREMKRFGVAVISVEPGFYKTEMTTLDRQISQLTKQWDQTSDDIRRDYTENYFQNFVKNCTSILTTKCNPNTREVVDCMFDAVTSTQPKLSYIPNFLSKVRVVLFQMVPSHVQDKLMLGRQPKTHGKNSD